MPGPGRFTRENNSFGNFSSPARSSRWKREKQSFRVIVCYRSNDRNRFPSLLPLTLAPSLSLSLFLFLFFFVTSFALFASFDSCPRLSRAYILHGHTRILCSTLAVRSFLCRFFHISAAPFRGDRISRIVDFISSVCSNLFLIPIVSSIPREHLARSAPDYDHGRSSENCMEFFCLKCQTLYTVTRG